MATSKSGGSTKNGRDSNAQRLGCKAFAGEIVTGGSILVRQHGTNFKPGLNVGLAKDHSLFAKIGGKVEYTGAGNGKNRRISVIPQPA